MTERSNSIELVFYSHPWSIHLLEENVLSDDQSSILVEVATDSLLAFLCGNPRAKRHGALPLLTHPAKVTLGRLANTYPLVPAPLVLAANPTITAQTLVHALGHACDATATV